MNEQAYKTYSFDWLGFGFCFVKEFSGDINISNLRINILPLEIDIDSTVIRIDIRNYVYLNLKPQFRWDK